MANPDEWIVLELNPRSEGENPDTIRSSIQRSVPKTDVFFPATVTHIGDDSRVHYLVEGYAFVRRGEYPDSAFLRLEASKFVQAVLSEPGTYGRHRRLSIVSTIDIEKMRQQIKTQVHQGIGIGDKVKITTGPYREIEATVIEEIPEEQTVQVFVKLRSKESIITIPRSGLTVLERAPLSPVLSRLTDLRAWLRQTRPVILWEGHIRPLHELYEKYDQTGSWLERWARLFSLNAFIGGGYDRALDSMRIQQEAFHKIATWSDTFGQLISFVQSHYDGVAAIALQRIQTHFMTLAWLEDIELRLKYLGQDIEAIAHHSVEGKDGDELMIQNVVVDGHNLAFRCLYAPGMSDLHDSKGRPTGIILGVLRSLGALRKRFPEARVFVAWDGTSRRRKKTFPDYKSNRPARQAGDGFDQLAYLRQILTGVGVHQIWNSEEEADDVIATVIRSDLKVQNNLIFSTDRDFLQLVTPSTRVLVPGTGIRKEILYDEAGVEEHFGVPCSKFLQLRAFYGDTSDNIPGVPRVPKKVLCSLVQAYGSVDQVYKSGLTGLSKGQYERLRAAEPQVRINLSLMHLLDVPVSATVPNIDADLVSSLLKDLEINPEPLLGTFFGRDTEAVGVYE